MADRTRLTGITAAGHINFDIHLTEHVGDFKRLADNHPGRFTSEVLIQRPSVNYDVSTASAKKYSRGR
jgi:hypothetical protein